MKEKILLQPGESYNTSPVIPGGKGKNLLEGGYRQSATIGQIQGLMKPTGVGAGINLTTEMIADDNGFFQINSNGCASLIEDSNEGIAFGQFTYFSPKHFGQIAYAASRETMGRQLQAIAQDHQKSFTAKFTATFNVLKLRAPNHCFDSIQPLPKVMKTDVHFYYLYDASQEKNSFYTYDDFKKDTNSAEQLGFCEETKDGNSYFLKKFNLIHDASETTEIILRPGDQLYVHKEPLPLQVVTQYTSDEIYELGGVVGYHMHAIGSLTIDGKEELLRGGHVLSFTGLHSQNVEITNVTRTLVNDNEQIREAYGTATVGAEIAREVLRLANEETPLKIDKVKAIASTILPDDFLDSEGNTWKSFIEDKESQALLSGMPGIWKSVIRNEEQRQLRMAQLAKAIVETVKAKNNAHLLLSNKSTLFGQKSNLVNNDEINRESKSLTA